MANDETPDLPLEVVGQELIPPTPEEKERHLQQVEDRDGPLERHLLQHQHLRSDPWGWAREISLFVSGQGWRGYQNVVGQPAFFRGYTDRMKTAVMSSPMLQQKVIALADQRLKVERDQGLLATSEAERRKQLLSGLREVVELMTDQMICKMESQPFIRGSYYVVTQLLTRAYHQGIHVDRDEVIRLRAVAEQAAKENKSIVFLPSHKTHVDYIALQVICYRLGITLPVVVAGDNLNFPAVGTFLQHAGAMWIRRSFGDDALYTTLVQSYIDTMMRLGYNFECFIEGGRSRTGKLLSPKYGILHFILDSVRSGRCNDCLICPVSIQYDKVIEVSAYISELLGQPKQKENLQDFLSASSVLSLKLGRVDVRFMEPWSLKDFIGEQEERLSKVPVGADSHGGRADTLKSRMLRTMGYKVLSDINSVAVVMPTALVGTVLLTLRGRGVGKWELIRKVDWLRGMVHSRGGRVAHFRGLETEIVVDRALEVLGPGLVGRVDGLAEPTFYAVDRFELSFYRNMTIHLFISEALISAALYTKVKQGGSSLDQHMSWDDLRNEVIFLSQLFRGEFIFPAGEGFETNLERTMATLEADGMIEITTDKAGQKLVGLSLTERQRGRDVFDFFCFLIWPFIEAAWLGAISLISLTPPTDTSPEILIEMSKAQNSAQLLGKTLYHQGHLSYFEAVNKEALKNAYTRYEEEGIIRRLKSPLTNTTCVQLFPEWTPPRHPHSGTILIDRDGGGEPSGKLWDFISRLGRSRREGKHRRDGAEVATKVVALAERLGRDLYHDAAAATAAATVASDSSSADAATERKEHAAGDDTAGSGAAEIEGEGGGGGTATAKARKFRRRSRL